MTIFSFFIILAVLLILALVIVERSDLAWAVRPERVRKYTRRK